MLQSVIDIVLVGVLPLPFFGLKIFPLSYYILFILGYFTLTLLLSYVTIQALIDKRKKDYVTETLSYKKYDIEKTLKGDHFGYSYIHHFYPKDMNVTRYKFIFIDKDGKKKKLRSVMSYRRLHKFINFNEFNINHLQITYLKRSKIIIHVELAEELDKKMNKKDVKEIEKALHIINMSL